MRVALAAILLASCKVQDPAPEIAVEDAWARASVPGQPSAAVYFTVKNSGGEDQLVSVSSSAGQAMLHSTSMDGGVMRMRHLAELDIPAKSTVMLKPGGTHVMLTGLAAPLTAGTTVRLELRFERSGERQVSADVRPATAGGVEM